MQLQGRNLSENLRGDDVKLLHEELGKLGFSINDRVGFFGRATRKAVLEFQKNHQMPATGVVDQRTARAINAQVDALQSQELFVEGHVRRTDGGSLAGLLVYAFDRDLRSEEKLGGSRPDKSGLSVISA